MNTRAGALTAPSHAATGACEMRMGYVHYLRPLLQGDLGARRASGIIDVGLRHTGDRHGDAEGPSDVREHDRAHTALAEVNLTPDGVGSTFTFMGRMFLLSFFFPMEWTLTRDE